MGGRFSFFRHVYAFQVVWAGLHGKDINGEQQNINSSRYDIDK